MFISVLFSRHLATLEHPIAYALYHITIRDSGLFFPKLMQQFRLLIFSFSKSLDGCAMTWVSQPALSCDQLALWVFLVDELFPPLSCTHPIHQRLQCVLERMFCKERWMINWVGAHSTVSRTVQSLSYFCSDRQSWSQLADHYSPRLLLMARSFQATAFFCPTFCKLLIKET